jgi:hypothetical protein
MPVVTPTTTTIPQASASPFAFLVAIGQWAGQNIVYVGAFIVAAFIAYILYRMFIKQKEEEDVFLKDYKRTKEMCKLQANRRRVRSSPIPIYIFFVFMFVAFAMIMVGLFINMGDFVIWGFGIFGIGIAITAVMQGLQIFVRRDKIYLVSGKTSRFVGEYGGECITEGWKNFLIVKGFLMKTEYIVRTSLNRDIEVDVPKVIRTSDGASKKTIVKQKIVFNEDPVIEGEDSIIIKGLGLQQYKYFLYPVTQDANNNPISMKFVATALEKDIALVDTLYSQTQDFARVMREQVNIHPDVRYKKSAGGESGATEG